MIVYLVVLCGTTKLSNRNNDMRIANVSEEKEKSARLLQDVLEVVSVVRQNSEDAEDFIQILRQNTGCLQMRAGS